MLSCRSHRFIALRRCSQASLHGRRAYSSKVRAFSFAISREKAMEHLSFWTAMFTGNKMFRSWLRHMLPGFGIDALKPSRLQAVYLPTWVIDAEVDANVLLRVERPSGDAELKKDMIKTVFNMSTMPGYVYPPLSTRNWLPPIPIDETVPWSEALRKNGADNVVCLPFSVSPLHLAEAARSTALRDAAISKSLRFEPASVKQTTMAVYPVLVPGYLAQFDIETLIDGDAAIVKLTSFMEASVDKPKPRLMVEITEAVADWLKVLGENAPDIAIHGANTILSTRFAAARILLRGGTMPINKGGLERWIDKLGSSKTALASYRERYFGKTEEEAARAIDWEDVRIRPFVEEEIKAVWKYMAAGDDLFVMKQVSLASEQGRENPPHAQMKDTVPIPQQDILQKHIDNAQKQREESKPDWLAQYELQQRLLTDPSGVDGNAADQASTENPLETTRAES